MLSLPALIEEVRELEDRGIEVRQRLKISQGVPADHALPCRALDLMREKVRGNQKIGTTGRGIGPAYEDKVARRALRLIDIFEPQGFFVQSWKR